MTSPLSDETMGQILNPTMDTLDSPRDLDEYPSEEPMSPVGSPYTADSIIRRVEEEIAAAKRAAAAAKGNHMDTVYDEDRSQPHSDDEKKIEEELESNPSYTSALNLIGQEFQQSVSASHSMTADNAVEIVYESTFGSSSLDNADRDEENDGAVQLDEPQPDSEPEKVQTDTVPDEAPHDEVEQVELTIEDEGERLGETEVVDDDPDEGIEVDEAFLASEGIEVDETFPSSEDPSVEDAAEPMATEPEQPEPPHPLAKEEPGQPALVEPGQPTVVEPGQPTVVEHEKTTAEPLHVESKQPESAFGYFLSMFGGSPREEIVEDTDDAAIYSSPRKENRIDIPSDGADQVEAEAEPTAVVEGCSAGEGVETVVGEEDGLLEPIAQEPDELETPRVTNQSRSSTFPEDMLILSQTTTKQQEAPSPQQTAHNRTEIQQKAYSPRPQERKSPRYEAPSMNRSTPRASKNHVSPAKASRKAMIENYNGTRKRSDEIDAGKHNGRIRFRDPYPVLKPSQVPRPADSIVREHTLQSPPVHFRWMKPKADLKQLIVAAMGSSLPRRSNACGALKVLTNSKVNQMKLVRTDSFLTAIIFAANQDIPIRRNKDLAVDARTRAVHCLRSVCEPKDNRDHVLAHPGFLDCMLKVIREDQGEAKVLACGALALLAKSSACREEMMSTEDMVEVLSQVLSGARTGQHTATKAIEVIDEDYEMREGHVGQGFSGSDEFSCSTEGSHETDEASELRTDDEFRGISRSHTDDGESYECDHTDGSFDDGGDHTDGSFDDGENTDGDHTFDEEAEGLSDEGSSGSSVSSDGSETLSDSDDELEEPQVDSMRTMSRQLNFEYKQQARSNACAVLLHLSKECSVSPRLSSNRDLVGCLVRVSNETSSPLSTRALEILCNLTRFPWSCSSLTKFPGLIETLVSSASSNDHEDRIYSLRSLQNISADSSSKLTLATEHVLSMLSGCAMRKDPDEKSAAIATLYNITTEPGAVVSLTNTKNVVATLVHLAHNAESSPEDRLLACEALATISLWLQTLAGTGTVPLDLPNASLPTQRSTGWERWD